MLRNLYFQQFVVMIVGLALEPELPTPDLLSFLNFPDMKSVFLVVERFQCNY
jgi:hypothetical protein